MPLNPNIILAGQQPNYLATIDGANRAAAFQGEAQNVAGMRNLLQERGPDIMAGNPDALGDYARFDPGAALGIQSTRQNMRISEQNLQMAKQKGAMEAQKFLADADAAAVEKANQEALMLLQAVTPFVERGDLQGAQNYMRQRGVPENEIPKTMQDLEVSAAELKGGKDVLDMYQPPAPSNDYEKYAAREMAQGRQPVNEFDYAALKRGPGTTVYGPDGTPIVELDGGAGKAPKTTEGEKSAAGYLSRMRAAEDLMNAMAEDGNAVRSVTSLLVGGTNFEGLVLSGPQERLLQAQRDWVRAKLRKESGAVIGADEMAEEIRTYFPLPGEDAETAAQKKAARKEAEKQFEIMSGAADEKPASSGSDQGSQDFSTPEAQAVFEKYKQ